MAKVQGYVCDVCTTLVTENNGNRPAGWMRLTPISDKPEEGFDICSNKCLRDLGKERYAAERQEKAAENKAARARPVTIDEDGLTRLPGAIHQVLAGLVRADVEPWYEGFKDGFRRDMGRGYAWICDLDGKQQVALADFLESYIDMIRARPTPQTQEDKNFIEACARYVPVLRSADG